MFGKIKKWYVENSYKDLLDQAIMLIGMGFFLLILFRFQVQISGFIAPIGAAIMYVVAHVFFFFIHSILHII